MGNYMETCIQRKPTQDEETRKHPQQEQQVKQESEEFTSDTLSKESSSMRVKLVLTKDELQWLLLQFKKDQGRKLEEVLGDIEKSRLNGQKIAKWKPCLESIMEIPEIYHHMDRFS